MSPVSDTELVKIHDAPDEAPAELSYPPIKLVRWDNPQAQRYLFLGEWPTTLIVSGTTRATIFLREESLVRVRTADKPDIQ